MAMKYRPSQFFLWYLPKKLKISEAKNDLSNDRRIQ